MHHSVSRKRIIDEPEAGCTKLPRKDRRRSLCFWHCLADQHAVAITVKTVSLLDGVAVGSQDLFAPGESRYQGQQARARQMKVREHLIHNSNWFSRINKNFGLGRAS